MRGSTAGLLNAERIKLTSIRSPRWSCAAVALCSLGLAALQGVAVGDVPLAPEEAVVGVAVLGVPLLMVLAAITVTNEYRSGMIRTTFVATPHRGRVMAAKAIVAASFSATVTALLSIMAVVVARLFASPAAGVGLSIAVGGVWRVVLAMAVYAALTAVLGVGVGVLLRHTAGAVALLLLWPLVVEPIIAVLPHLGPRLRPYLPFGNALGFVQAQPPEGVPWGPVGCLLYFVAVVAAVFVAGVLAVDRRDA